MSIGGDTDTLACIAGALAEAREGATPPAIAREAMRRLGDPLREEVRAFAREHGVPFPDESD